MLNNNYLIEKSKTLVWTKFNTYTAGELKLLDVYLSRINARNPDSCNVKFTKKEYCKLMNLHPETKVNQLKEYTSHLLGNVLTLDLGNGYSQYTLFTYAQCTLEDGQNIVEIECNPKLKQIFFNLAEDRYIKYRLKNIVHLRSQYSILLYNLLKDKEYASAWFIELSELKELLGATKKSYNEFKEFNRSILKKSQLEINSNTDINFHYEKKMNGRNVKGVIFNINSNKQKPYKVEINKHPLLSDCFPNFSDEEIHALYVAALKHIKNTKNHDLDLAIVDFINQKYSLIQAKKNTKNIFNRLYSYVLNNY